MCKILQGDKKTVVQAEAPHLHIYIRIKEERCMNSAIIMDKRIYQSLMMVLIICQRRFKESKYIPRAEVKAGVHMQKLDQSHLQYLLKDHQGAEAHTSNTY